MVRSTSRHMLVTFGLSQVWGVGLVMLVADFFVLVFAAMSLGNFLLYVVFSLY